MIRFISNNLFPFIILFKKKKKVMNKKKPYKNFQNDN